MVANFYLSFYLPVFAYFITIKIVKIVTLIVKYYHAICMFNLYRSICNFNQSEYNHITVCEIIIIIQMNIETRGHNNSHSISYQFKSSPREVISAAILNFIGKIGFLEKVIHSQLMNSSWSTKQLKIDR